MKQEIANNIIEAMQKGVKALSSSPKHSLILATTTIAILLADIAVSLDPANEPDPSRHFQ